LVLRTQHNPLILTDILFTMRKQALPIDGQLFGNQGLAHNYHFTYEGSMKKR
jgi:hypothetical protein